MKSCIKLITLLCILGSIGVFNVSANEVNENFQPNFGFVEEATYEPLDFEELEEEYVVTLPADTPIQELEISLWIYREYAEQPGYYNFMIRDRKVDVDEWGQIHIDKNPNIIGIWDAEEDKCIAVPWLYEMEEEGLCWKTGNFYLMHDGSCDFLEESNQMHLVIYDSDDSALPYEYTIDESEERQPVQNGNCICLAEGDRLPIYTEEGCLKEFASWESRYTSVEIYEHEQPETNMRFQRMKVSDFPDESYVGQIVIKKNDGSFFTTDFMLFQTGITDTEDKQIELETEMGSLSFILKDGTATLKQYIGTDTSLIIPEEVEGCTVTSIDCRFGGETYFDNSVIENLYIPAGVNEISSMYFAGEDNVLNRVTVAEENESFIMTGECLYSKDGKILYKALTGSKTFFEIPEGVEEIKEYAFADANIHKIIFPETLRIIGHNAFENVILEELNLPESLEVIEENAFLYDSLWIEDRWEEIGYSRADFAKESSRILLIGKNVEYIGVDAFSGEYFESFYVDEGNLFYKSQDGMLLTKDGKYLLSCPTGLNGMVYLPEGIEKISASAFHNNGSYDFLEEESQGITDIVLPSSMKYFNPIELPQYFKNIYVNNNLISIRANMFNDYNVLLHMPDNKENILDGALLAQSDNDIRLVLLSDEALQGIFTIPDTVTSINRGVFKNVYLKSLVFPKGLSLSDMTSYELAQEFKTMEDLEEITVDADNEFFCSIDGVLYSKDLSVLISYPRAKEDESFKIPEGVKAVAEDAFYHNEYIKELSLPSTLKVLYLDESYNNFLTGFKRLSTLTVSEENPYYLVADDSLVD